ncbi:MAG: cysteine hydrolase [Alicyclobacillus sp.]|nr:cysteine hydrolase [Alicyclobacillus sp.]
MAKALLVIDMSNDFIARDGSLNCGEAGLAIVPYCVDLLRTFLNEGQVVLDARDLHDPDDYEIATGLFPPHNMRGTPGRDLIPDLAGPLAERPEWWIEIPKKHYNAGYRTNLFEILDEREIDEVHMIGVCTDICVRYTANALYEWKTSERPNLRIVIHRQGVASFNPEGHRDSLQHFEGAFGFSVV